MLVIDCEPDVTVNRPTPVKGVPFVVTVTSRTPRVAPAATVMFAARLVALLNATELIVMPDPKLTVDSVVNTVFSPAITTVLVCPCCAEFGATLMICGKPVTTNAFG